MPPLDGRMVRVPLELMKGAQEVGRRDFTESSLK